jgi:uncharacterized membrane protein
MRLALIKLQANKELGQSYAGLYALNEGLHVLGYLDDGDYEVFKRRYSDKLVEDKSKREISEINSQEQKEILSMTHYFREVLLQWNSHPSPQWRKYQFKKAQQYANRIPYAKLVLDKEKNPQVEE